VNVFSRIQIYKSLCPNFWVVRHPTYGPLSQRGTVFSNFPSFAAAVAYVNFILKDWKKVRWL